MAKAINATIKTGAKAVSSKTQRDERKHRSPDGIAAVPHT
jgi:hypothetical protein